MGYSYGIYQETVARYDIIKEMGIEILGQLTSITVLNGASCSEVRVNF